MSPPNAPHLRARQQRQSSSNGHLADPGLSYRPIYSITHGLVKDHFGGFDNAPNSMRVVFIIQFVIGTMTFLLLFFKLEEPQFDRLESKTGILSSIRDIFKEVPGLYKLQLLYVTSRFFMQIRIPFLQLYFYEVKNANVFIIGWQGTVSTTVSLLSPSPLAD